MGKPGVRPRGQGTHTSIRRSEDRLTRLGAREGSDQRNSQRQGREWGRVVVGREKNMLSIAKITRRVIY